MALFANSSTESESIMSGIKTKLVPLFPTNLKPGALCCMCERVLDEACMECQNRVLIEGGKPHCPLVVTQMCRHTYHGHCAISWLLYDGGCIGSRPGLSKSEDEEDFLECGIEIDA